MIKLSILTPVWNQEELVIKGLDSIPRRDDIEVIVRDDGSTDNTLENLKKYKEEHPELKLRVYSNGKNLGVAATANKLLAAAKGEWFHFLMSDDTVLTNNYSGLIEKLYSFDGDILAMDLLVNNGDVWHLDEEKDEAWCAQACRFIRRSFVDGIKYPEKVKAGEDWFFHQEIRKRNPKVEYSGVVAYRYNFPREGSLMNLRARGLIADEDLQP
jgi:glycosyltransferase involved in cell wall biosynthesis